MGSMFLSKKMHLVDETYYKGPFIYENPFFHCLTPLPRYVLKCSNFQNFQKYLILQIFALGGKHGPVQYSTQSLNDNPWAENAAQSHTVP